MNVGRVGGVGRTGGSASERRGARVGGCPAKGPARGEGRQPRAPKECLFCKSHGLVCMCGAVLGSLRRGLDKSRRSVAVGVTGLGLNSVTPRLLGQSESATQSGPLCRNCSTKHLNSVGN